MVDSIISTPGFEDASGKNEKHRFAYYETMNSDYRRTQEDALAWHVLEKDKLKRLSALDIAKRLWTSYKILDKQIKDDNIKAGSTASTTVYDGRGNLITATLADASSFVVIYDKDGKVLGTTRLNSLTHSASDPSEKERIEKLEGSIINGRVYGLINISRALGDHEYEANGNKLISSDAKLDITNIETLLADKKIDPSKVGSIQVISTCDGFTDAAAKGKDSTKLQHEEFLAQSLSSMADQNPGKRSEADIAKHLAGAAKASGDNISIAVQTIHHVEKLPLSFNESTSSLIGLYDGHGGKEAAHYAAQNIGTIFSQQCKLNAFQYAKQEFSANNQELFDADNKALSNQYDVSFVIDENDVLHEQLKQAINFAQIKYKTHYGDNTLHARGEMGFFSTFRHGVYGQKRSLTFNQDAQLLDSYDQVTKHLSSFLNASETRYHRHSFSSYLLDELSAVLKHHKKAGVNPDAGRHYDPKTAWSNAKEQFDALNNVNLQKEEVDAGNTPLGSQLN